ncbi:14735_t:CDS:2 [Gigaspora margarita]|uniref:14735_t:CDS:1 n=1 Tax=Gigaspora margarita TaxID=4874 RepID=A0ABN7UU84_GIGMA|nr:14735_t:CDS:2 [Gigaspora margarita]
MGYGKLRKLMNTIATNTDINLDNGRLITNHSCRHTTIQLLKNNGVSDSGHQSRDSLADIVKPAMINILNTAMLIPFSSQDEYDYSEIFIEEYDDAQEVSTSKAEEVSIPAAQEISISSAQEITIPAEQEITISAAQDETLVLASQETQDSVTQIPVQ